MRKLLSPAGFIWEMKIPRNPDGRAQGFGFAAFTCKAHAEKAIQLANGKLLMGRPVAVDWAVAKAQYATAQKGAGVCLECLLTLCLSNTMPGHGSCCTKQPDGAHAGVRCTHQHLCNIWPARAQ